MFRLAALPIVPLLTLAAVLTQPAGTFAQSPFSLSEKDEIELGRHAAAAIDKDARLIEDPAIVKYINDLGQSIVQQSTRSGIAYNFKVVDSREINAFALPGGFIYVNRGLIEAAENESELAGVLGHEIGHVVGRHGAEQAVRAGLVQTGLGALASLLGRGAGSSISQMAGQMVANGVFMKFSREAERQADSLGARMLYDASIQPIGMVSFFDKLAQLQKNQPNAVQKFFSSHPSPVERSGNVKDLIAGFPAKSKLSAGNSAFADIKKRVIALPRPEEEAAKTAAVIAAAAKPPVEPAPDARSANLARDREIAARFAPIFHQGLGPSPRFDYITNFDFDGDWRGDNNWRNAEDRHFALKGYVYYSVFETRTHYFIQYAAFHPHDYKGGESQGALLSQVVRLGAGIGGQYDPTGRSSEAVLAHENDLEGAMVVAEKGADPAQARLVLVETLAHNNYLKYVPAGSSLSGDRVQTDGVRPHLFVEPKGHGIESWRDDAYQRRMAERGFLVYSFKGAAEDPDATREDAIGYELLPAFDTFWPRAAAGKNETFGEEHDYGILSVKVAEGAADTVNHVRLGKRGSALNGAVGAANMSRPPWGWFDGQERDRLLGEWFLLPAETTRRRWNLPESFSTTYIYHPYLGKFR